MLTTPPDSRGLLRDCEIFMNLDSSVCTLQALPVTEISPEGEVFHSVDHTARTALITPTKTLRGEVVTQVLYCTVLYCTIGRHPGGQGRQGGLQGAQPVWPRHLRYDCAGEAENWF